MRLQSNLMHRSGLDLLIFSGGPKITLRGFSRSDLVLYMNMPKFCPLCVCFPMTSDRFQLFSGVILRFQQVTECPAWCPLGTPVTKNKPGSFMCVCAYITRWVVTGILSKGNIWASFFYTSRQEGRRESWRWSGFSGEPHHYFIFTMRDADIKWRAPLASVWPSKMYSGAHWTTAAW